MQGKILLVLVALAVIIATGLKLTQASGEIRYAAVGDSYTAGTSVDESQSWPRLLTKDLRDHGVKIKLIRNLAVTSTATREVIAEQLPQFDQLSPTFATLLIGVNDFNRGYSIESFQKNLGIILDRMLAKLPKNRLVVITIPDFSVTLYGKTFGSPAGNSLGIAQFNEIIKQEAGKRNLPVVDIFSLSQEMGKDSSLVASDGLHPSAKEYKLWEKEIFPVVYDLLKR